MLSLLETIYSHSVLNCEHSVTGCVCGYLFKWVIYSYFIARFNKFIHYMINCIVLGQNWGLKLFKTVAKKLEYEAAL